MTVKHLGGNRYHVDFSTIVNGKRKRTIKIVRGKRAAYGEYESKRTKIREGEYAGPIRETIAQAAALYLAREKKRVAIQTYLQRKSHCDKYIVPSFGEIPMAALSWQTIEDKSGGWKVSAETVKKVYQTLNRLYTIIGKKLGLRYNP